MSKLRIRYSKTNKENVVKSQRLLKSDTTGALYRVKLNYNSMEFEIYNVRSERIVKRGGKVTTKESLQKKVKRELKKLGVSFKPEVRDV